MIEIDETGALRLAAAIARQWIREQPDELPAIARWLDLDPDDLRRRMRPPATKRPSGNWPTCAGCGAPLPDFQRVGRPRRWCSEACRYRATR
jgi:hypothetical protein